MDELFPIKKQPETFSCNKCESKSMEECLLIRHCPYWIVKVKD